MKLKQFNPIIVLSKQHYWLKATKELSNVSDFENNRRRGEREGRRESKGRET